jgi:Family of unknown function (DUF6117)
MKIPKGHKANLETLIRAAKAGRLVLLDCQEKSTSKPVTVLACVSDAPNGEFDLIPFARLFDGNPYEELNPPNPDGEYHAT